MIQKGKTAAAKKNKKKAVVKKKQANEIHRNIEQIVKEKLSEMGLIELSTCPYAYRLVFSEIERRIKLIQTLLTRTKLNDALEVVNSLLNNPQESRR